MKDECYELAEQYGMSKEFIDWFFDKKKSDCGNVWLIAMAAMWEGWKGALSEPTNDWNGKGLPPVGCECEWFEPHGGWTPVKIVYKSKWVIVIRSIKEGLGKDVEISRDLVMDKLQEFRPL